MQVIEIKKKQKTVANTALYEEKEKKLRKEHEKLVKGMFEFVDAQGGWLDFTYRYFKGDPIQQIRLIHGEIVELPMGIVKHLNNTSKKIRTFAKELKDSRGVPSTFEKVSRVRFTPIDVI